MRRANILRAEEVVEALKPSLGSPFFCAEGFVLYQGDSLSVLQAMKRQGVEVNLTLTSPPYNIGKSYESPMPMSDYLAWCSRWMQVVREVTSASGTFWLNVGYLPVPGRGRAVPISYFLWDRTEFFLQQEIVWHYGAGVTAKRVFAPRNEKWLFFTKNETSYTFNLDDVRDPDVKYPNQKKNGRFRCNPLGKNPSDVWSFPKVTSGENRSSKERTTHPAQFPLRVVDRIVKVSSNRGDVLMDPFAGSGSAGVAAVGNGRVFVGVELRLDYCEAAARRFERFLDLRGQEQGRLTLG